VIWQKVTKARLAASQFRAHGWHHCARPRVAPGGFASKRLAPDSERQLRKGACSESLHAVFNNIKADVQTSAVTAKVKVEPVMNRRERAPRRRAEAT
jgi:hypothetical protein